MVSCSFGASLRLRLFGSGFFSSADSEDDEKIAIPENDQNLSDKRLYLLDIKRLGAGLSFSFFSILFVDGSALTIDRISCVLYEPKSL